jgi:secernin
MCDTLVVLPNSSADGALLFAKNSDREPNEAHYLQLIPAANHPAGAQVQCTYIQIPQVAHTYAVLLAKPFWMWGAEMGANQHGVVIGNEAVFTKMPYDRTPGLIGMDLLRLALERGANAGEALRVITGLLAAHGQGGNCGLTHPFYYHNSYLIADPHTAWILETAGREWAARQVHDVDSISNALTIGREWDLASPGLVDTAIRRGWCRSPAEFDFARCYSDFLYTRFGAGRARQACTADSLHAERGRVTPATLMGILRSHRASSPTWSPGPALAGADVCMHAGWGPIRGSQTTGSLVSHITPELQTHWATATSAPCTSLFKPVWLDAALPGTGPIPSAECDPASLWWRHERLHRATLANYPACLAVYNEERDRLEANFLADADELGAADPVARAAFSADCFQQADAAEAGWLQRVCAVPPRRGRAIYYRRAWQTFDRQAKIT